MQKITTSLYLFYAFTVSSTEKTAEAGASAPDSTAEIL